jgi:hypothetical protein
MDAAVSYGVGLPGAGPDPVFSDRRKLFRDALDTLAGLTAQTTFDRDSVLAVIAAVLRENRHQPPQTWHFGLAINRIRKLVSPESMPWFYDYLLRYAELLAARGERPIAEERRARLRIDALVLFELGEALRLKYASGVFGESILGLSSRPVRNAARLCLSIGRALRESWYFERAAYYCLHVIGTHSQQPVERVAVLIIQAITVRFRGTAAELTLAMKIMKTAERALINYPDRIQLWIRFYLERAKLFRERALQTNISNEEGRACVYYCKADVNAVLRLASDRRSWIERAQHVLRELPEFPGAGAEWRPHGTLSSGLADFVAL